MTCFWDGLISKLTALGHNYNINSLILFLKTKIKSHADLDRMWAVEWNGEKLRKRTIVELAIWVRDYNINNVGNGHDCSICDPFLLIICANFQLNINHNYNGHIITYKNINATGTIHCSSDMGHFW